MTYEVSVAEYESVIGALAANTASTPYDVVITDEVYNGSLNAAIEEVHAYIKLSFKGAVTADDFVFNAEFSSRYIISCDLSNLTYTGTDIQSVFSNCGNLKTVIGPQIPNVEHIYDFITECPSLTSVKLFGSSNLYFTAHHICEDDSWVNLREIVVEHCESSLFGTLYDELRNSNHYSKIRKMCFYFEWSCNFDDYGLTTYNFQSFTALEEFALAAENDGDSIQFGPLKLPSIGLYVGKTVPNDGKLSLKGVIAAPIYLAGTMYVSHLDCSDMAYGTFDAVYNATDKQGLRYLNINRVPIEGSFSLNKMSLDEFHAEECRLTAIDWGSSYTHWTDNTSYISSQVVCNDTYALKMYLANNNLTSLALGYRIEGISWYESEITKPSFVDISGNENFTTMQSLNYNWEYHEDTKSEPLAVDNTPQNFFFTKELNFSDTGFTSFNINNEQCVTETLKLSNCANLSTFSISKVCPSIRNIDLLGAAVETIDIEASTPSLTELNLFNCTNLKTVEGMQWCSALTEWVELFSGCTSLRKGPIIPTFVTSLEKCFIGCSSLTESPIIPSSVINLSECFKGCTSLVTVQNIPSSIENLQNCFENCSSLSIIKDWQLDISQLESGMMDDCFKNCPSLASICTAGSIDTESGSWNLLHYKETYDGGKTYKTLEVYNINGSLEKKIFDNPFYIPAEGDPPCINVSNRIIKTESNFTIEFMLTAQNGVDVTELTTDWVVNLYYGLNDAGTFNSNRVTIPSVYPEGTYRAVVSCRYANTVTLNDTILIKKLGENTTPSINDNIDEASFGETITLHTKSAELCLSDSGITDEQRIEFQTSKFHYAKDGLDPTSKNFVLWKDPDSKFKTNIDFGGGGGGASGGTLPLGSICSFSMYDEPPTENWLKCDGSTFNKNRFPALFTFLGNSDTLPIEYDLENPNTEVVGKEIFVGEIAGRKVYQLTVIDTVDRSSGWYDFTTNFSDYITPSEIDYFVDGAKYSHIWHDGDGYVEDAWGSNIVGLNRAKTMIRVYSPHQNYAMDYSDERGQNTPKYLTVRFTRMDDSQTKAEIKYKYIRAITGIEGDENDIIKDFLNSLEHNLQGYAVQPLGSTISSLSGVAPAGYLKADGSTFDTIRYPLLSAMLGGSNKLPVLIDYTNHPVAVDEEKFIGFWEEQPLYEMTIRAPTVGWSSGSWYTGVKTISWIYDHDIKHFVLGYMSNHYSNSASYENGMAPAYPHIDKTNGLNIYTGSMSTQISANYMPYITLQYVKNNPDMTKIPYRYIKAVSGTDEEESTELVDFIRQLLNKVSYNTLPLGHIINMANESFVPTGYLKTDGSTFDAEEYPLLFQYLGQTNKLPNLYDTNSLSSTPDIAIDSRTHTNNNPSAEYVAPANWKTYLEGLGLTSDGVGFEEDGELHFFGYYWRYFWIQHTDGTVTGMQIPFTSERCEWYVFPIKKGEKIYGINQNGGASPSASTTFDIPSYARMNIYYYHRHQFIKAVSGLEENAEEVTDIKDQIQSLINGMAYNTLPVGNVIELANNNIVPAGYLPCDGSTFDENEYPLLYAYLGQSNKLPSLYKLDTAFGKQDVGLSTRSDYNPRGVTYTTNMGDSLTQLGLRTDGAGFPSDGYLFIETYHWYFLWIEDVDGTIQGYMTASRDDTQSTLWLPIKKGQKLYGWNRNGSANPIPSTDWVQSTSTKLYIWYAKEYKYIKAVSGVEDNSEEASTIVAQMQTMIERMAYNNQPVGHTMTMANNLITPSGYLLADGSEFDETKYPLLYEYLGRVNKLPYLPTSSFSGTPDWFKSNYSGYQGTADLVTADAAHQYQLFPDVAPYDGQMTLKTDDWFYLHITHADGTQWTTMVGIRDNGDISYSVKIKKGDTFCCNRTVSDYTTWAYYEYCSVAIWYYKEFQYIKAVSGLDNNSEEAEGIVEEMEAMMDKMAYNTLPVGHLITMSDNRATPFGYLLADGRDTTGTADELQTKYPLLYEYLGHTNILPEKQTRDTSKTPNWFKTNYTSNPGTAELVAANAASQHLLFPEVAEHDGFLNLTVDDWCYFHVTHSDGTQVTKMVGCRDNGDNNFSWEIKKGDTFCMNRTISDYTTWAYYEYCTVAIWYYDTFQYIKAVSGISDNTEESSQVINAINEAVASLTDVILPTRSGSIPGYVWID